MGLTLVSEAKGSQSKRHQLNPEYIVRDDPHQISQAMFVMPSEPWQSVILSLEY